MREEKLEVGSASAETFNDPTAVNEADTLYDPSLVDAIEDPATIGA